MTSQSLATLAWANHGAPYEVRDSGTVKVASYIVYFRTAVLYNIAEMFGSNNNALGVLCSLPSPVSGFAPKQ